MKTVTISLVVSADNITEVEAYVRDAIENADQDWEIETATLESDGVITDLLDDEVAEDDADESDDTSKEAAEEEAVEEEDAEEETEARKEPSGKEF